MGSYQDDGLIILRNVNTQETDKTLKNIIIFNSIKFKIEITTNLTKVDFLNVTFNLELNTWPTIQKGKW